MSETILQVVDQQSACYPELEELMIRAFPENERVPMHVLMRQDDGHEMLAVLMDGAFVGFISLLTRGDICHILFFATKEELRGMGIGAKAMALLRELKPGLRIIADLEDCVESAPDLELRRRRMDFYHRCGFEDTQVSYEWRGEYYVIVSNGGDVTGEEFGNFWRQ